MLVLDNHTGEATEFSSFKNDIKLRRAKGEQHKLPGSFTEQLKLKITFRKKITSWDYFYRETNL